MRSLPKFLSLATLLGVTVTSSGCIERSLVVKVKKDGSGVVHLRSHVQEVTIAFASSDEDDEKPKMPTQQWLTTITASMGNGVKLISMEESTNRSGWPGFDVIWEFDDVSQLRLPDALLGPKERKKDKAEQADKGDQENDREPAEEVSGFRFAMKSGELMIHPYGGQTEPVAEPPEQTIGAVDPFASEPVAVNPSIDLGAASQQILAAVLAEMRVGVFVEVDGEITESNAKHRKDNLITLISIHVGEMLKHPDAQRKLKKWGKRKPSRSQLQQMADTIDGLEVDFQDPIRVKFQ